MYVALSRAKSLNNIRILRQFDTNICREPHKQVLLVEMERLNNIENNQLLF